jgi:hypothetical protein
MIIANRVVDEWNAFPQKANDSVSIKDSASLHRIKVNDLACHHAKSN